MAHEIPLVDGLTIGKVTHTQAVLRAPTAGQLIEAARQAEMVVTDREGRAALAVSPTLLSYAVLGAQIERIGDYEGPFTMQVLGKLSGGDLERLQIAAALLEQAEGAELARLVEEALARGRADSEGAAGG